jgi:hypothetical protein
MTYWQSLCVGFIPGMTPELATEWNDLIFCVEMAFFAFLHYSAFNASEFKHGIPEPSVLNNAKAIFSVKDVFSDAYNNFMPAYNEYQLQSNHDSVAMGGSTAEDLELEVSSGKGDKKLYRTRTFLVGNVNSFRKKAPRGKTLLQQAMHEGRLKGHKKKKASMKVVDENGDHVAISLCGDIPNSSSLGGLVFSNAFCFHALLCNLNSIPAHAHTSSSDSLLPVLLALAFCHSNCSSACHAYTQT